MGTYYLIIIVISLASMWVSNTLKRKFKLYSQKRLRNGMSGKEIAEKMLSDHGIRDVKVVSVRGSLTDHYDPRKKTVNLSESVYSERNAAAAAVAAHECGHAVQHAKGYQWLQIRSTLVPMVSVASNLSMIVIIGGLVLMQISLLVLILLYWAWDFLVWELCLVSSPYLWSMTPLIVL